MDTSNYRVDLDGMQALIDKAAGLEKRIEDRLGEIRKRIADLHITWVGDAAHAHASASAEWATGAAEMNTALGELRQALDRARAAYHAVGPTNHAMWPR
ncbi:WXG100 family type VII secretion target [Nocardia sp. NPDC051570]|uniref:WXG100 family type VII secretion target n=1 Tax=Nocardia sp. NPDC051570 TaxID=3364324 RepID=UPI0037A20A9E